ncbi:hypothetical protein BZA05DRAFT_455175 [Tricharina praecox]|uniref:uncharacterized protein n=1 Tax=Tricharina praecox TaxID=43433 RepID=UPI002220F6AC|nr:uncharacterized protein BZA05DRAFT_455175 [Tricharina praecox]KAI5848806.1 hypothetical protein BZA05DRAFT_455175 [Tricharina praecox]
MSSCFPSSMSSFSERSTTCYWPSTRASSPHRPKPFYALYNIPSFTLHHDGATSPLSNKAPSQPASPDSSRSTSPGEAHRRCRTYIFGTPTSQAGTPDDMSSVDSKVEDAHGDVGMDPVRDERGSRIGSFAGSLRSMGSLQFHDQDGRVDPPSISFGGGRKGGSAWALLDQPGMAEASGAWRSHCGVAKNDGPSSHPSPEMSSKVFVPSPPLRTRSNGSRFSEDLAQPKRSVISLQWIKKKVRRKTDVRSIGYNSDGAGSVKGKHPMKIPHRLKKRSSTAMVLLPEATETSSKSNIDIYDGTGTRHSPPNTTDPIPAAAPFLSAVDSALTASSGRHKSRVRQLSVELNRFVTAVTPTRRSLSNTSSFEFPTPPARSQSAPPRNSLWELEFLPSEATGVKTPREYPVYNPMRLGGKVMPRAKEMNYFSLADMVQSQPPLAPVGEYCSRLDPKATPATPTTSGPSLIGQFTEEDCRAIAPFMEQDRHCETNAKAAIHQRLRRASLHAKSMVYRKPPSDAQPLVEPDLPSRPSSRLGAAFKWIRRTSTSASTVITDANFSARTLRRGQDPAELEIVKPAEVILAEKKRRKRDSGVIGLHPVEDFAESTDSSLTYASAVREIAGLGKYPAGGKKSAREGVQRLNLDVGDLVTPVPPHFPVNTVHPGALLQEEWERERE